MHFSIRDFKKLIIVMLNPLSDSSSMGIVAESGSDVCSVSFESPSLFLACLYVLELFVKSHASLVGIPSFC